MNYTDNGKTLTLEITNGCGTNVSNGVTITVNIAPDAPTSITSSNGSTICTEESTTLKAIGGSNGDGAIYQWGTGICGSNIISGQSDSTLLVIPSITTTYWVRRIGIGACNSDTTTCSTLEITIIPNNTVSNVSSDPILCINTPNHIITHTTTGAIDINTATNLPVGVTATWENDTITIFGKPSKAGIFDYSISLTGGCGIVNATGTITVISPPTVTIRQSYISTNTLICCVDDSPDSYIDVVIYKWSYKNKGSTEIIEFSETTQPYYTFNHKIDPLIYDYSVEIDYENCLCPASSLYSSPPSSSQSQSNCLPPEEPLPNNPKIKLFPNPAKNELNIEADIESADLQIIEVTGKVVIQSKIIGRQSKINISSLKAGFYILILKDENTVLTSKFIVE